MKLVFATGNKHKQKEISEILGKGIKLEMKPLPLQEPDLATIEEVASFKAKQAYEKLKCPVITEDTGVYFLAYRNFPGHLAKRVYESIGFRGITALIKAAKNRKGCFKTVICYRDSKEEKLFSGTMKGTLSTKVYNIKADRLPYEKVFFPEGSRTAVVNFSREEKNKISHRAKAARKLRKWLLRKRM